MYNNSELIARLAQHLAYQRAHDHLIYNTPTHPRCMHCNRADGVLIMQRPANMGNTLDRIAAAWGLLYAHQYCADMASIAALLAIELSKAIDALNVIIDDARLTE